MAREHTSRVVGVLRRRRLGFVLLGLGRQGRADRLADVRTEVRLPTA
jgi:hypothetical protein